MRRQPILWAAPVAAAVAFTIPATSASGQSDACGDDLEGLTTYVPRAAHAGQVFSLTVEHDGISPIANATVAFGGQVTPFTPPDGRRVRVLVRAPQQLGDSDLSVAWEQPEEGLTCVGSDDYTVQILRPTATIGDTLRGRIDGRWRIVFRPINFRGRGEAVRWRIRPLCDAGACGFRVQSSTGRRFRYKLGGDNALRARGHQRKPFGECTRVREAFGEVISRDTVANAFTDRWRNVLDVDRERDEYGPIEALTVTGTAYHHLVPTPAARAIGCTGRTLRERITGRRL